VLLEWLKEIYQLGGHDFSHSLLYYIYKRGDIEDEEQFRALIASELTEEIGAEIMSLAQQHRQEGRQEGIQIGIEKGIEKGILQGMQQGERKILLRLLHHQFGTLPNHYRELLDQATDKQLLNWSDRVLSAQKLEDIFND